MATADPRQLLPHLRYPCHQAKLLQRGLNEPPLTISFLDNRLNTPRVQHLTIHLDTFASRSRLVCAAENLVATLNNDYALMTAWLLQHSNVTDYIPIDLSSLAL